MNKNPYKILLKIAKDENEKSRYVDEFIFSQTDNLMTWLCGFSVAAITLLISNYKYLIIDFKIANKILILCFSMTILFGLIFRCLSYLYFKKIRRAKLYLDLAFEEYEFPPMESSDLDIYSYQDLVLKNKKRL